MAYVHVTAKTLENFLQMKKFTRKIVGKEVVYTFSHLRYQPVAIKVWTSLPADGGDARGKGEDAIRVTAAYEGNIPTLVRGREGKADFGIYKAKRIFRVGSEEAILDRLHERMRDAYQYATQWLRDHWKEIPHQHVINFNDMSGRGGTCETTARCTVNFLPNKMIVDPLDAKDFNIIDIRIGTESQLPLTGYNNDPLSREMPATVLSAEKDGMPLKTRLCPKGTTIVVASRNLSDGPRCFKASIVGYIEGGQVK